MGERCATSGCMHGNLSYYERGEVGSWYCAGCYAKVLEGENRSLRDSNRRLDACIGESLRVEEGLRADLVRLRDALGHVRPALKWIENHAPELDPHALASHAHLALDTIARAVK
jgi:hypothetical protein